MHIIIFNTCLLCFVMFGCSAFCFISMETDSLPSPLSLLTLSLSSPLHLPLSQSFMCFVGAESHDQTQWIRPMPVCMQTVAQFTRPPCWTPCTLRNAPQKHRYSIVIFFLELLTSHNCNVRNRYDANDRYRGVTGTRTWWYPDYRPCFLWPGNSLSQVRSQIVSSTRSNICVTLSQ